MGVWDALIGLASSAIKDKPRHDVLYALLDLRAAMRACHKTYADYQIMVKQGNYESQIAERERLAAPEPGLRVYNPLESWQESVIRLAETLARINTTLQVLSPKAAEEAHYYHFAEGIASQEGHYWHSMIFLKENNARIDLDRRVLRSNFKKAMEALDSLIRANFKPEELFKVADTVKEWPYPYVFFGEYWLKYEPLTSKFDVQAWSRDSTP